MTVKGWFQRPGPSIARNPDLALRTRIPGSPVSPLHEGFVRQAEWCKRMTAAAKAVGVPVMPWNRPRVGRPSTRALAPWWRSGDPASSPRDKESHGESAAAGPARA